MAETIQSYLDERITAFQLDEVLSEISISTEDPIVKNTADLMWGYYDDLKDHKIVASKQVWDFFVRQILLLKSDAEIEIIKTKWNWSVQNAIAGFFVLIFVFFACHMEWGFSLCLMAVSCGIISMLLDFWASHLGQMFSEYDASLIPFPSIESLLSVRRSVPIFFKTKYPGPLRFRRIRKSSEEIFMWIPAILAWLMFGPLVLFIQMLPEMKKEIKFRIPEQAR